MPTNSPTSTEQVIERLRPWLQHTLSCVSQRDLHNDTQCRCGLTEAAEALSRNTPEDSEDQPITEADLERWAPLPAGMEPKPVDGEVAELVELLELGGDYAAEVFNDFPDKTSECALRVKANIERFDKAGAALSRNTEPMVTDAEVERLAALNPAYAPDDTPRLALNIRMHTRAILTDLASAGEKGTDDA